MYKIKTIIKTFFGFKSVQKIFSTLVVSIFFGFVLLWVLKSDHYNEKVEEKSVKYCEKQNIQIGDIKREYFISSSAKELKNKSVPLFIFLHGMEKRWPNPNDTKLTYDFISQLAQEKKFIAIFPKGSKGSCDWDNNKHIDSYCWSTREDNDRVFIKLLKEYIQQTYKTDANKIYLSGFSNGGFFVANQIFRHHLDDNYTGYGIHSGGGYIYLNDPIFNYKEKFPIFMSVGRRDIYQLTSMRYLGNTFLKLGWNQSNNLRYFEFNGEHEMSKSELQDEIYFFLEHQNKKMK